MKRTVATAWLLGAVTLLSGCADPQLDAVAAADAAVEAFRAAGLDVGDPRGVTMDTVDLASVEETGRSGEVWLMALTVEGEEWTVGVDPRSGAVVRTFEPPGSELTDEQASELAGHRHNPDAARSSRVRRRVAIGVIVAASAVGYAVLRTLARRSPGTSVDLAEPDD